MVQTTEVMIQFVEKVAFFDEELAGIVSQSRVGKSDVWWELCQMMVKLEDGVSVEIIRFEMNAFMVQKSKSWSIEALPGIGSCGKYRMQAILLQGFMLQQKSCP